MKKRNYYRAMLKGLSYDSSVKEEVLLCFDLAIKDVFNDLNNYRVRTGCILINQLSFEALKKKHLNTHNTDSKNKGVEND